MLGENAGTLETTIRATVEPVGAEVLLHREGSKATFSFFPFSPLSYDTSEGKLFFTCKLLRSGVLVGFGKRHAVFLDLA